MSTKGDRRTFRNEDLVLKVTENIVPLSGTSRSTRRLSMSCAAIGNTRRMRFERRCDTCLEASTPTFAHLRRRTSTRMQNCRSVTARGLRWSASYSCPTNSAAPWIRLRGAARAT